MKRRRRKLNPTLLALIAFLLIIVPGCGVLAYTYYTAPFKQFIHSVSRDSSEPPIDQNAIDSITGRTWNMLLMGSDNDGKYTFPAVLTQVMMLVHIDTVNSHVYLVSIPRDSWVYIPEVGGMHKIDQAFFLGAVHKNSFDDGVRLARLTVEQDYGITIDRYAWIGLSGFARVINTVGGVDIDLTHPLVDDAYPDDTGKGAPSQDPYALRRLYLTPGPQHLNGEEALEYVRSRHADLKGDIGRTQRQQQVLDALQKKLNVGNVVGNLPQLIKDLSGQVYTDMSEQEVVAFANFGRTLSHSSIQRLTLGPGAGNSNFGRYASVYDPSLKSNQSVLLPNCDTIEPVVINIFGIQGFQTCDVNGP